MKHCPPTPVPSTTDLQKSPAQTLAPVAADPGGYEIVHKLRIEVKSWFRRCDIEHVMHKRRRSGPNDPSTLS
jgi:hypothetical protein